MKPRNVIDRGEGAAGIEVLPERATPYVDPVTGESGLTFAELAARYPELYPDYVAD